MRVPTESFRLVNVKKSHPFCREKIVKINAAESALEQSPLAFGLAEAQKEDAKDALRSFASQFQFPSPYSTLDSQGTPSKIPSKESEGKSLYFAGHSLGLMPKSTPQFLAEVCQDWGRYGVEGHFKGKYPWLPYHENLTGSLARLVGAKESEVVAMNSLTTNLHLAMVSFYQPKGERRKILIEKNAFPSDQYAVQSQASFHGFDPSDVILETDDFLQAMEEHRKEIALVLVGNCNYLSGRQFDVAAIAQKAKALGGEMVVGLNLAHGAGNLQMELHAWGIDFAVWCSYKYLNSGPGGIAGMFVHERHHHRSDLPRFAGWWGTNKGERFLMKKEFDPIGSVEAWQLSNPPIFQLASLRASMEIFDAATMPKIAAKARRLTSFLERGLKQECGDFVEIVTPPAPARGAMLCLRISGSEANTKRLSDQLEAKNILIDFRRPNIFRLTPAPLYNSFEDGYQLVKALKGVFDE
jgi:kynureninase